MSRNSFRVALVQAQQVATNSGLEVFRVDVVRQIGLDRTRSAGIRSAPTAGTRTGAAFTAATARRCTLSSVAVGCLTPAGTLPAVAGRRSIPGASTVAGVATFVLAPGSVTGTRGR
ncbi:hypothetical protein JOE30_002717 [Rhodococcus sp. PvP016]|uniref:Uncharacterized protein n=1 Tax=Rhodococcoides corynebacterioides TaxID=53972 RepID=A0ABS2KR75_9NOCA|nr:hypothetical protein [Rhodococcus corynebacterioides]MBP1116920.1 hypothetical protein [Rhodococcus sp. PvP016]